MRALRKPQDLESLPDNGVRRLIRQRMTELVDLQIDDPGLAETLILVEPGDTPNTLEAACGCWITSGLFEDARFGEPDFMPSFEWLEYHATDCCYEMLFILNDNGDGTALFIPDDPQIDAELLAFCRTYATPALASV